jgi:hypothetical protein
MLAVKGLRVKLAVTLLKMFGGQKRVYSPYYLKVGNLKKK